MVWNYRSYEKWGVVFGTVQESGSSKLVEPLKFKRIALNQSPVEIFSTLYKKCDSAYLLESIEGPKKLAQFSFIGFDPKNTVRTKDTVAIVQNNETGEQTEFSIDSPLNLVKDSLGCRSTPNKEFRFAGGAVGYVSFDAVRNWEKLPQRSKDDLEFPDLEMGIFDDGIVFDHRQKRIFYYYYTKNRIGEIQEIINQPKEPEYLSFSEPRLNFKKEAFERAVEKAKNYIYKGDIFQVVLSKRFDFSFEGDLTQFYSSLRTINPSPYMYFLKNGNRQIVGSSPEMLGRVDNRTIETYPIAGTRPRTTNQYENRRLAKDLLADPKERAEHIMLVDLARNDVGRVAKFGSVRVPEFMQVHKYSHVQHIVSRVIGDLKEECDSFDALRAVFPAGTVSGAPKVRAMEIIEELEPTRRGPYAGAVGYFSYNGNSDFAITIRTLFADKNKAHIQVGAGIVADSVPEREWFETEQKAGALLKALQISGVK